MKKYFYKIAKKSIFINKSMRLVWGTKDKLLSVVGRFQKVDENLVVFEAYLGKNYTCSPKAIYEEMLADDRFKEHKFVWFFSDMSKASIVKKDRRTTIVKYSSLKYYLTSYKAKVLITNSRMYKIVPRKTQKYIQTWHGTPFKKIGCDIIENTTSAIQSKGMIDKTYIDEAKRFDNLISPSKYASDCFTTAFGLEIANKTDAILEIGYPRNDFLINHTVDDVTRIKKSLNIPMDKKVILYAPTWRDNQHAGSGYTQNIVMDFDLLKCSLSDGYVILFRAHYFIANSFDFSKYEGFVYDVSKVDDINDVYIISDLLITDYSSVFFDYANLNRPILFYMYDIEEYKNDIRGLYLDTTELPGDVVTTTEEVSDLLIDLDAYRERTADIINNFNNKFTYLDDGRASKRLINLLLK